MASSIGDGEDIAKPSATHSKFVTVDCGCLPNSMAALSDLPAYIVTTPRQFI